MAKMNIDLNVSIDHEASSEGSTQDRKDGEGAGSEVEAGSLLSIMLTELENRLEIGNIVDSVDQAYLLYCEYGRCRGFNVRKGDQYYFSGTNELRWKEFECSCEGRPDDKRSKGRVASYRKRITKSNCKAKLRIGREKNLQWTVHKFVKEHNHEMLGTHQAYLLRSARQLSHAKQSLVEALKSAGIGSTRVGNVDGNALVNLFTKKSNIEPFFYWNVQLDDEVDTTYKTNRYGLVCAPFIGINHHRRNVMLGLGFLSNEMTASFEWLFATFLESMHGKEPQVIFSDQSQALMNGIDATFKSASHRLCQWHISRNAPSHFGKLNSNSEFKWLKKRWASVFMNTSFLRTSLLLAQAAQVYTRNVYKAFESQFALTVSVAIIEKPANNVGSVDLQFKVASQPLMSRIQVAQYNNGNEAVDEMAFVNYVMKITLEVAHDVKNHQQGRKTCLDRIRALKGDMHAMVNKGVPHKRQKARDLSGARADKAKIWDPSLAKRWGKTPINSHWKQKKPNPNPPPSVPKWPSIKRLSDYDVEPSVQIDTNTEQSNEGGETDSMSRRPASQDYVPTTSFEVRPAALVYKNEGKEFWAILKELFDVDDPSNGSSSALSAAGPGVDEIDTDDMDEGALALDSLADVDADDTVDEAADI
ncbi:hypothetical protein C2S52_008429 [Perilla frutescens var. hirtella]|nr:hypothetical protein C2S52_008429 [Perilla frutescens var. hirtella]